MYKFNLTLKLDDDGRVYYNNKSYGFYEDDLIIDKEVRDANEAIRIVNRVDVVHGFKLSETLATYLAEVRLFLRTGSNKPHDWAGNQTLSFDFEEIIVPTVELELTHSTTDGDTIKLVGDIVHFYELNRSVDEPAFTTEYKELAEFVHKKGMLECS